MKINTIFEEFLSKVKEQDIVLNYVQVRQHGDIILDWGRMAQKTRLNMKILFAKTAVLK